MPVHKFRSVEEMPEAVRRDLREPADLAAIGALWRRSQLLFRRRFPPGVFKHRSVEELNQVVETWRDDAIRARRERRDGG